MTKTERSINRANRAAGKLKTRQEILRAAEKLMLKHGVSAVTTRQISQAAQCSDGALYGHFKGRSDLLLAVLDDSLPAMLVPFRTLHENTGLNSPEQNLTIALRGVRVFHRRVTPLLAGVYGDGELHAAYRKSLARQDRGPHLSIKTLAAYINAEQTLGRIDRRVNARLAAHVLISASFFRTFCEMFFGRYMQPSWPEFTRELIHSVLLSEEYSDAKCDRIAGV